MKSRQITIKEMIEWLQGERTEDYDSYSYEVTLVLRRKDKVIAAIIKTLQDYDKLKNEVNYDRHTFPKFK